MQDKRRWLPCWQRVELVELCLDRGLRRRQAAAWRRVSVSTVQYWIERDRSASDAERAPGGRTITPPRLITSLVAAVSVFMTARERTGWGPRLIASELGMAHATVSRCLQRRGVSRRPPAPREAVQRFEWPCPGDLLQMDNRRMDVARRHCPLGPAQWQRPR
jgi:transposase